MKAKTNTTNPKKLRRAAKIIQNRALSIEEVIQLRNLAIVANAPSTANTIMNIRGEITQAESDVLLLFIRCESIAREMGKKPDTGDIITPETRFV